MKKLRYRLPASPLGFTAEVTMRAIIFVLAAVAVGPPAPPQHPEAKLDADTWARRNIELLRWVLDRPYEGRQGIQGSFFGFSLPANPLLMRDPYAADVAELVEKYEAIADDGGKSFDRYLVLLRQPESERLKQLPFDLSGTSETSPDGRPPTPDGICNRILNLPDKVRPKREPELIEKMESAAWEQQEWGQLGLAYYRLAGYALGDKKMEHSGRYIDRLMTILREHPVFQDPQRGNSAAVQPSALARLMLKAGRRDQLEKLMDAAGGDVRTELTVGLLGALAEQGKFDAARAAINEHLREAAPEIARRLTAALEGKIILPPQGGEKVKELPPSEARVRGAQSMIASGFAARGDVDTAGKMRVELDRDNSYHHVGKGRLAPYDWSQLAMLAAQSGHKEAARRGFEHAIESMHHDTLMKEDEREEEARLIREAVSIGNYKVAEKMLETTRRPGAWARLEIARTYRKQGQTEKARAMLDEALKKAHEDGRAGSEIAKIAVELHTLGDEPRAEKILLEALDRIEGVDFGFGGAGDVVAATIKMKRPDLLERIYQQSEPSQRLLLCIVVSNAIEYGVGEEEG